MTRLLPAVTRPLQHVAHLFVRDPLVIMKNRVHLDDSETDHFENLQSTNWQTVRWKPPPKSKSCGPHIGWRVEFRSMEVQLTDFENAAFTTFVVLVSRVILAFGLNLYVPLSKVDENMRRAHKRDAVRRRPSPAASTRTLPTPPLQAAASGPLATPPLKAVVSGLRSHLAHRTCLDHRPLPTVTHARASTTTPAPLPHLPLHTCHLV